MPRRAWKFVEDDIDAETGAEDGEDDNDAGTGTEDGEDDGGCRDGHRRMVSDDSDSETGVEADEAVTVMSKNIAYARESEALRQNSANV